MQTTTKNQLHALNCLKVLAILLVFNSHCGNLYPVEALATGGALGNALFFIISGYLLKISPDESFWPRIKKRIVQLYPGMLIVSVIYAVAFRFYPDSFPTFVTRFIWPTGYWFVGGLLLFDAVIYFLEKKKIFDKFLLYSVVIWVVYFAYYFLFIDRSAWTVEEHGVFRLIYYFYIYSFGYCLKSKKIKLNISSSILLLISAFAFTGNFAWKFAMSKVPELLQIQCICQILGVLFAVSMLLLALNVEESYCRFLRGGIAVVDFWSRYSLEIYLTQRTSQRIAQSINFPINLIVAVILTLMYSLLLKKITGIICSKVHPSAHA